jgi:hypothetical protein
MLAIYMGIFWFILNNDRIDVRYRCKHKVTDYLLQWQVCVVLGADLIRKLMFILSFIVAGVSNLQIDSAVNFCCFDI